MWPEAPAPWTPGQGLPGHPDASPSAWDGARARPSRNRVSSLEPHTATTSAEYAGTTVLCCGPAFLQPHGTAGSHAAGLPSRPPQHRGPSARSAWRYGTWHYSATVLHYGNADTGKVAPGARGWFRCTRAMRRRVLNTPVKVSLFIACVCVCVCVVVCVCACTHTHAEVTETKLI